MNFPRPQRGHDAPSREGMLHRSNIYASGRVVYQLVVLQYLLVKALFVACKLPSKSMAELAAV